MKAFFIVGGIASMLTVLYMVIPALSESRSLSKAIFKMVCALVLWLWGPLLLGALIVLLLSSVRLPSWMAVLLIFGVFPGWYLLFFCTENRVSKAVSNWLEWLEDRLTE